MSDNKTLFDFLNEQLHDCSTEALRNTACIVTFSSSRFGEEVRDDALASELANTHGTDSSNLNVTKKLFAGNFPELDLMEQHIRSTYNKQKKITLPWKKRGGGLLPNTKIPEYFGLMAEASQRLEALRANCRTALPAAHARAKARLGSAYRESDYRDINSIPDRFMLHFEVEPIPDSNDLLMPEGYQELQLRGLFEGVRARFARAIETVWHEIRKHLLLAKGKCEEEDAKRWHGSLITNITSKTDELLGLGLIDDETFLDVVHDVARTLKGFDIKRVAGIESERKRMAKECKRLIDRMDSLAADLGLSDAPLAPPEPAPDEISEVPCGVVQGGDEIAPDSAPDEADETENDSDPEDAVLDPLAALAAQFAMPDQRQPAMLPPELVSEEEELEQAEQAATRLGLDTEAPCVDEEPAPAPKISANPTMDELMRALLSGS